MKVSQENYQVKKKSLDVPRENEDPLFPTLMTLKSRFLNLKGNSILINFLSGYTLLNEYLSIRRSYMRRKLNWLLLDCKSTLHYGGLTCVLSDIETIKIKFVLGRR